MIPLMDFLKTILNGFWAKVTSIKPNWNQNNPSADDYIRNRPFYEEVKIGKVIHVDNLTYQDYDNGNAPACNFVPGEAYNVVWNGTLYENLVCYFDGEYNIIADGVQHPFYIDDDGGDALYVSSDDENWTLSIYQIKDVSVLKKLDAKFLPDDIGMQSDWMDTNKKSKAHILNKPSIWNNEDGELVTGSEFGNNDTTERIATKEYIADPKSSMILSDEINGYDYVVAIRNGNLVSYPVASSIKMTSKPTKTKYLIGDPFIPDGMVIIANCIDGSTREVFNYTYDEFITEENLSYFVITYTEGNNVFTVPVNNLSLHDFSLIDFNYTANDDGTYTLTSWKGTYNGKPSTRIIVPNSELIII